MITLIWQDKELLYIYVYKMLYDAISGSIWVLILSRHAQGEKNGKGWDQTQILLLGSDCSNI